ncbi:MAG: pentapeptide repeat-containing protein [Anaerolineae bacterium]|nr:pentapeptide repeat-containing protein [Anaerolineae bacterium]
MIAGLKRLEPVQRLGLLLLALAGLVTLIGTLDLHPGLDLRSLIRQTFNDFYSNMGTELASIAITVLIIDRLQHQRAEEREKQRIILQMGSPDNAFAIEAVRMMNARGWLTNGDLKAAQLSHANLEAANLQRINLDAAHLGLANLRKAKLSGARLTHAFMQAANLDGANLCGADLRGANLNDASLVGAKLDGTTRFDTETILPDCNYWSPGTDLDRFTDPQNRDFWRSHNPNSPAHHP